MSGLGASHPPVVDLDELVDGQKVRTSVVIFLALAILSVVADGFSIAMMGVVGPELVRNWHISPHALLPLQLAGVLGLLIGAPMLGGLGDRLTAEVGPKRLRGMFIIVNFGVPAGFALPGVVSAVLVSIYGWPVLFLVGGLLSLGIGVCAIPLLPESIRYLLHRSDRAAEATRLARRLRPDLAVRRGVHRPGSLAVHRRHHGLGARRAMLPPPGQLPARRGHRRRGDRPAFGGRGPAARRRKAAAVSVSFEQSVPCRRASMSAQ